jgi:hypothetical protein
MSLPLCDAVGVYEVYAVWDKKLLIRKSTAMGNENWVYSKQHSCIKDAVGHLKKQKMQLLIHLFDNAVDFRDIDYTEPPAIVLGQKTWCYPRSHKCSRPRCHYSYGWHGAILERFSHRSTYFLRGSTTKKISRHV